MVEFPFAAAPEPPAPTDAELQRWYDNHPDMYSTPEYRRIKAIVLSPETLAKDIPITDAELHAAYEQHKAEYVKPAQALGRGGLGAGRGEGEGAGGRNGGAAPTGRRCRRRRRRPAARRSSWTMRRSGSSRTPTCARAVFAAAPDTVSRPGQGRAGLARREGDQGHAGQRAQLRSGEGRAAQPTCWPPRRRT